MSIRLQDESLVEPVDEQPATRGARLHGVSFLDDGRDNSLSGLSIEIRRLRAQYLLTLYWPFAIFR